MVAGRLPAGEAEVGAFAPLFAEGAQRMKYPARVWKPARQPVWRPALREWAIVLKAIRVLLRRNRRFRGSVSGLRFP